MHYPFQWFGASDLVSSASFLFFIVIFFFFWCVPHRDLHSFPTRRSSDLREISMKDVFRSGDSSKKFKIAEGQWYRKLLRRIKIGRAVQQECRDRSRMPSSA